MSKAIRYPEYEGNLAEDLGRESPKAHKYLYDFLLIWSVKYFQQVSKDRSQTPEERASVARYAIFKTIDRLYHCSNNEILAKAVRILKNKNIDHYRKYIKRQNESLKKKYNLSEDEIAILGGEVHEDELPGELDEQYADSEEEHPHEENIEALIQKIDSEFQLEQDDYTPQRGKFSEPQTPADAASTDVRINEIFKIFWKDLSKTNVPTYKKLSFWLNNVQEVKNKETVIILKSLIGSESAEVTENDAISSTCLFEAESPILFQINEIIEGLRKVDEKSIDVWLESAVDKISFLVYEEHKINKKEVAELLKTVHKKSNELKNNDITTTNVSHWANQCKSKLAEITILK